MGEFSEDLTSDVVEPINPQRAYIGRPGYGVGRPWHARVSTWTSRDGRVTKLRDLTDEHLTNVIAFLERRARSAIFSQLDEVTRLDTLVMGDAASDALDDELRRLFSTTPEEVASELPIYRALCREADRRAAALGYVPAPETAVYAH